MLELKGLRTAIHVELQVTAGNKHCASRCRTNLGMSNYCGAVLKVYIGNSRTALVFRSQK